MLGARPSAVSPVLVRTRVGGPSSSYAGFSDGLSEPVTDPTQVVIGDSLLCRSVTTKVVPDPSVMSVTRKLLLELAVRAKVPVEQRSLHRDELASVNELFLTGTSMEVCPVVSVDGRPVGFLQIIDPAAEETHYWGDVEGGLRAIDIWIGEEEDLGRGYGTRMMRLALERCFADPGVGAVLIDPLEINIRARRFYERLGFRLVERRRFGDDDCCVYRLERSAWT